MVNVWCAFLFFVYCFERPIVGIAYCCCISFSVVCSGRWHRKRVRLIISVVSLVCVDKCGANMRRQQWFKKFTSLLNAAFATG